MQICGRNISIWNVSGNDTDKSQDTSFEVHSIYSIDQRLNPFNILSYLKIFLYFYKRNILHLSYTYRILSPFSRVHLTSNYPIKGSRVKSSKIKKEIITFVMQIHAGPSSKDPHATSHGREALPLQPLWSPIRPSSQPASPLARAHWWTSIRVRVMFSQVQWLKSTESSSTDPQGRETVRMRTLPDAIPTKAPPDTSQVWHQYQLWTSNEDTGCLSVLGKRRFRWGYRHWYRRRSRGSRSIIIGQQKNKCFS